jgi:chaperonin GroEL (HSP60 family)
LHQAEDLLQVGLHTSDIISGYEKAGKKALEILDGKSFARERVHEGEAAVHKLILF